MGLAGRGCERASRMTRARRPIGWLTAGTVAACVAASDDPPVVDSAARNDADATAPDGCGSGGFSVEPGTGVDAFVPLAEGDLLEVVHGPQGGWHLEIGGRVRGASDILLVNATAVVVATGVQIAGDQVPTVAQPEDFDPNACEGTFFHKPAFVDDREPTDLAFVCSLAGEALDFTVHVTDGASGLTRSAGVRVTAALDPDDEPLCGG